MKSKWWIIGAVIVACGATWCYKLETGSESDAILNELLTKKQAQQVKSIKAQAAEWENPSPPATQNRTEDNAISRAIPELPEWGWKDIRAWNLPLNNPAVGAARDAFFLEPDDYVLGVLVGKHARAYPWFVLANYHAVNDNLGGKSVIVNLCEACNGGAAFLADINGTTIDFRPRGVKNGTWYAIDFQTNSLWYPFIGEAFDGPLKGTRLKRIRSYFSTWRQWVRDHPETTVVITSDEVRNRQHGRTQHMASDTIFNPDLLARLATGPPNPKLDLLASHHLIFGLIPKGDAPAVAYSLDAIKQAESPLQTRHGDIPVLLFVQNQYQVGAYVRQLDDTELEMTVDSDQPLLLLDQLGNRWNAWGRTTSGPDHPSELPIVDGYLTKWYEWLENYPETTLISNLTD